MNEKEIEKLVKEFRKECQQTAHRMGVPEKWDELYTEMCFVLAQRIDELADKPVNQIIMICKDEAMRKLLGQKEEVPESSNGTDSFDHDEWFNAMPDGGRLQQSYKKRALIGKMLLHLPMDKKHCARIIEDISDKKLRKKTLKQDINGTVVTTNATQNRDLDKLLLPGKEGLWLLK